MQDRMNPERSERQVKIERQIARVNVSIKDMQHCLEFTSIWDESLVKSYNALNHSGCNFVHSTILGQWDHPKATGRPLFSLSDLTKEEQQLHTRLCDVRNQAIAHSDFRMSPSRPVDFPAQRCTHGDEDVRAVDRSWTMKDIHSLATKVKQLFTDRLVELVAIRRVQAQPPASSVEQDSSPVQPPAFQTQLPDAANQHRAWLTHSGRTRCRLHFSTIRVGSCFSTSVPFDLGP